ncbi:MAG: hypothetical protein ACP5NS_04980 [Candidatus Pacearchaeota archaeon]
MNTREIAKKIFNEYEYVYEPMNLKLIWQKPDPEVNFTESFLADGEEERVVNEIEGWVQEAHMEEIIELDDVVEYVANSIFHAYAYGY